MLLGLDCSVWGCWLMRPVRNQELSMHTTSRFALALVLAIVLGLAIGCARKPDDAKISGEIQSKFSQDSGLSTKQLTVQASDGVVTLAGTVDNDAQREAASRQAASVPGVKTVVNDLKVANGSSVGTSTPPSPIPAPTSTTPLTDKPKPGITKKAVKISAPKDSIADQNPAQGQDSGAGANQIAATSTPTPDAAASAPPTTVDNATAQPPPPPAPATPRKLIVDPGTPVTVRLIDPIDSEKN